MMKTWKASASPSSTQLELLSSDPERSSVAEELSLDWCALNNFLYDYLYSIQIFTFQLTWLSWKLWHSLKPSIGCSWPNCAYTWVTSNSGKSKASSAGTFMERVAASMSYCCCLNCFSQRHWTLSCNHQMLKVIFLLFVYISIYIFVIFCLFVCWFVCLQIFKANGLKNYKS